MRGGVRALTGTRSDVLWEVVISSWDASNRCHQLDLELWDLSVDLVYDLIDRLYRCVSTKFSHMKKMVLFWDGQDDFPQLNLRAELEELTIVGKVKFGWPGKQPLEYNEDEIKTMLYQAVLEAVIEHCEEWKVIATKQLGYHQSETAAAQ